MKTPCHFCGEELSTQSNGVGQWTAGWVESREGGGGHSVMLPQRASLWAHRRCIDRVTKGFDRQNDLFGGNKRPVIIVCTLCGRPARFGVGVSLQQHLGTWYCADCWPKE
jgi:hypothetical protein